MKRIYVGGGVWLVRCRYRDTDGVTRIVQRVGPANEFDKYEKLAEDPLVEAMAERRSPSGPDAIGLDTLVVVLIDQHITCLAEDSRSVRTLDTYRYDSPDVPSHSFRKAVATLIDDVGLSACIGADRLGHAKVSVTQDRYTSADVSTLRSSTRWIAAPRRT